MSKAVLLNEKIMAALFCYFELKFSLSISKILALEKQQFEKGK